MTALTDAERNGPHALGFRFVYQRGAYNWWHPAEVQADAIDCTDMTDAEFAAQVRKTEGA